MHSNYCSGFLKPQRAQESSDLSVNPGESRENLHSIWTYNFWKERAELCVLIKCACWLWGREYLDPILRTMAYRDCFEKASQVYLNRPMSPVMNQVILITRKPQVLICKMGLILYLLAYLISLLWKVLYEICQSLIPWPNSDNIAFGRFRLHLIRTSKKLR